MKTLILGLIVSFLAGAQTPAPADAKGCAENPVVPRMPGCAMTRCQHKQLAAADMPRTQSERTHTVGGEFDRTIYKCPQNKSPLELGRNTEAAFKGAGFNVFYTYVYGNGARFYLTAQKGGQWVHLSVLDYYDLTTVKEKPMEQVMTASAESWAQQVNQTRRVSVYGINFDTGKALIRPDSEPVLGEVARMLQANSSWAMLVAGHTDKVGAAEVNLSLSRQRAESVISWLAGRGIDKARLVPPDSRTLTQSLITAAARAVKRTAAWTSSRFTKRPPGRHSPEFLGESDEKPFTPADVAKPVSVFVLDYLVDELRAAPAEPLQGLVDVVHGEHDAEVPQSVHRRIAVIRDHRRREEPGELEPAVAVRRPHHRNLDALIAQSGDTSGPFSFDGGPPLELETELAKEINGRSEVLHDDSYVVHSFDGHMSNLQGVVQSQRPLQPRCRLSGEVGAAGEWTASRPTAVRVARALKTRMIW